jgi:hypothetical protein
MMDGEIMTRPRLKVAPFHCDQYVEVKKAVVNRSNQSVCHAVGDQAEMLDADAALLF